MLPLLDYKELEDDEKIFGESYDSEDEDQSDDRNSIEPINEIDVREYGSEENVSES